MATITGSTSRNSSKYTFKIEYTVTEDNSNERYKVTAKTILVIKKWKFESGVSNTATMRIGTNSKSTSKVWKGGNNSSNVEVTMVSNTVYYAYSSSARSITISASTTDISSGGYGPGVCSASKSVSLAAKYVNKGAISASSVTQSSLTINFTGLQTKAGFSRTITWYLNGTSQGTTTVGASNTSSSFSKSITGLLPSTRYTIRARIVSAKGTSIRDVNTTVTTTAFTASFSATMGDVYANITISGLRSNIGYTRRVNYYYKKSTDSAWTLASVYNTIAASSTVTSYTQQITGLTANQTYNFRAEVIATGVSGSPKLGEKTATGTTVANIGLIPLATISNVEHRLNSRVVLISWSATANVVGTSTYRVQYKLTSSSAWINGTTLAIQQPVTTLTMPSDGEYDFRISVLNSAVSGVQRDSNTFTRQVYLQFDWDTPKVKGEPFNVSAEEWNRLVAYLRALIGQYGTAAISTVATRIPLAVENGKFTVAHYNTIVTTLNTWKSSINLKTKSVGDGITASLLNTLRDTINKIN